MGMSLLVHCRHQSTCSNVPMLECAVSDVVHYVMTTGIAKILLLPRVSYNVAHCRREVQKLREPQ